MKPNFRPHLFARLLNLVLLKSEKGFDKWWLQGAAIISAWLIKLDPCSCNREHKTLNGAWEGIPPPSQSLTIGIMSACSNDFLFYILRSDVRPHTANKNFKNLWRPQNYWQIQRLFVAQNKEVGCMLATQNKVTTSHWANLSISMWQCWHLDTPLCSFRVLDQPSLSTVFCL